MDDRIDAEVFADGANGRGLGIEGIGDVLTGLEVVGLVSEFAAANILGIGDLSPQGSHFAGDVLDKFFNREFGSLHIENDKSFVLSHDIVVVK